ncbi:l-ascorbate oxidase [Moniliophthora roreri MCA 2997]|uniref:Peroxidase n=1 Tax=Moniliophthora roreri (strain MCA 2997) TaxID=1381753 RepID=V2WXB4_MONRO|nr:l-ascorbate oxidase [Moniliophthora roreri MCA 2997]
MTTLLGIFALILSAHAYTWPDPKIEFADKVLYQDSFLPSIVQNCVQRDHTTVSAQWVRLAYHDMATYDAEAGTGGLDGSIVYELHREQNKGVAMTSSLNDLVFFTSPATGPVASCGGPVIPFRAGRIDATSAGPETVPEPHEDLAAHTANFKRQGFSQQEMIGLVACGHSLGGVSKKDFPDIILDPKTELVQFANTHQFDNKVVTDYLSGTTINPLVIGPNTTTNSDLRIFGSDGNSTMKNLASADNFSKTCATLYEKMINSVSKGTNLTEVINPIEYKVLNPRLFPGKDGSLTFSTSLRLLTQNPKRKITLHWTDRRSKGTVCPTTTGCSVPYTHGRSTLTTVLANKLGKGNMVVYGFEAKVNATTSMSKFWFEVDEGNGSKPIIVDNGGKGYRINQDVVLFDRSRSSLAFGGSSTTGLHRRGGGIGGPAPTLSYNVVVAARGGRKSNITAITYEPGNSPSNFKPIIKHTTLLPDSKLPSIAGFTFYSATVTYGNASLTHMDIIGEVCGKTYKQKFIDAADLG